MRAAVCPVHGPPEVVVVDDDVAVPVPGPGEVRVEIAAAAVNFPDVLLVGGTYQIPLPAPFVPGSEFAGVVVEVGEGVDSFSVGDRVMGTTLVGAFAEEVAVATRSLRPVPDGVPFDVAAASGVAHRTAWHVLRSIAHVEPGQELLVLGAGGGVGLAAVQLGALLGARVTAVASSPEKLEVAAAYGATTLIDHRTTELRPALRELVPGGVDVVIDPVGGDLSEAALRGMRWGGRFVTVGYASGEIPRIPLNLVLLKGVVVTGFQFIDFATHRPDELERNEAELVEMLVDGRARPHVGATFDLDGTAEALRLVADGGAIGKVVIVVRPEPSV